MIMDQLYSTFGWSLWQKRVREIVKNEGKLIIFSSISINANRMQSSASLQREFDIEIKLFQHSTLGMICFISSFIIFVIALYNSIYVHNECL